MPRTSTRLLVIFVINCFCLNALSDNPARAHFPWLKTETHEGQPRVVMVFGETPNEEDYKLPEKLAGVKIWRRTADSKRTEIATEKVETEKRIGLVAPLPNNDPCAVEMSAQYGVYGNWLLTYYAKHIQGKLNEDLAAVGASPDQKFDVVPRAKNDTLELTVLWNGQPQPECPITVTIGDKDPQELKTAADGTVTVEPDVDGLVAAIANFEDKDTGPGALDGKKYTTMAHFATLTFGWRQESRDKSQESKTSMTNGGTSDSGSRLSTLDSQPSSGATGSASAVPPPLPEAVSSFGAAVCDGWLYVYSGHTGTEHDHSAANQSKRFIRAQIDGAGKVGTAEASGTQQWEALPMQTPLQGLVLVGHGGKVYRVGGMNARNATTDDDPDLHSVAEFTAFDPVTNEWTGLAPLPAARSSHNAVVIGDKLYVTGGWTLAGTAKGAWLDDSLVYDFNKPASGWQKLPPQSFQRRALAAGDSRGRLVAIGGMDERAKVSQRVDVFDPATSQWSEGPTLPGKNMAGFGVSAWNLDGNLYVSGFQGRLYRWDGEGPEWEEAARLEKPRFFHQLVPAGPEALFAVGGATSDGHLVDVERINVQGAKVSDGKDEPAPAASTERPAADAEERDRA